MWRKTRQPHTSICIGADPNRNFDFHHAEVGASKNPCAETYAGPKPFSEPEVLALSEFVKTFDKLKLYISFHSYSQLLLFPYVSSLRLNFVGNLHYNFFITGIFQRTYYEP